MNDLKEALEIFGLLEASVPMDEVLCSLYQYGGCRIDDQQWEQALKRMRALLEKYTETWVVAKLPDGRIALDIENETTQMAVQRAGHRIDRINQDRWLMGLHKLRQQRFFNTQLGVPYEH